VCFVEPREAVGGEGTSGGGGFLGCFLLSGGRWVSLGFLGVVFADWFPYSMAGLLLSWLCWVFIPSLFLFWFGVFSPILICSGVWDCWLCTGVMYEASVSRGAFGMISEVREGAVGLLVSWLGSVIF
jgi:hypothetical protein